MGRSNFKTGAVDLSEDFGILPDVIGMAAWVEQVTEPHSTLGRAQGQGIRLPAYFAYEQHADLFSSGRRRSRFA